MNDCHTIVFKNDIDDAVELKLNSSRIKQQSRASS